MDLNGQCILLTGASGGIGQAIADRLAARGARLLLVGRSTDRLEATRRRLLSGSEPHVCVPADVTTASGRAEIRRALDALGRPLDVLINGAGISRFSWLTDALPAEIETQLATNITAPILLTQTVLPYLHGTRGRIINIGSSFGGIGYPGFSTYCASKFALRGFTEALRRELSDSRIQIAYLAPRATSTPMNSTSVVALNQALGNAVDPPERVAQVVEDMLRARRMRNRAIGWPEGFFLRLNAIFPTLVDGALRKQLAAIKRFAAATPIHS